MSTTPAFLPYGRQWIDDDDVAAVTSVLRGDWLTCGPAVTAFETALARETDATWAVACSSGTAALHMAAHTLDLAPGEAVAVPAVTFLATANAVRYVGGEVLFTDVDPDTGLMGPDHLRSALARAGNRRARALFPVHLNGQCVDLPGLAAVAAEHDLVMVEDGCHALGSRYPSGDVSGRVGDGRHGAMTVFSFHPVKTIAMGEGGAVTGHDPALRERLLRFRNHGMVRDPAAFLQPGLALDKEGAPNPWYYEMPDLGFNYRASDLHAALGASQLAKLARFVRRRRELAALYDAALAPLDPVVRPVGRVPGEAAWHLYVVHVDFPALGVTRARLVARLREEGIGSQVHYLPVSMQPYYRRRYGDLELPGAWSYYRRALSLPLFPAMTDEDVARVVAALARAAGKG